MRDQTPSLLGGESTHHPTESVFPFAVWMQAGRSKWTGVFFMETRVCSMLWLSSKMPRRGQQWKEGQGNTRIAFLLLHWKSKVLWSIGAVRVDRIMGAPRLARASLGEPPNSALHCFLDCFLLSKMKSSRCTSLHTKQSGLALLGWHPRMSRDLKTAFQGTQRKGREKLVLDL